MNNYLIVIKVTDNAKTYNFDIQAVMRGDNMKSALSCLIELKEEILKDKKWIVYSICKLDDSLGLEDIDKYILGE